MISTPQKCPSCQTTFQPEVGQASHCPNCQTSQFHVAVATRDKWRMCPHCNVLFQAPPAKIVSCPGCQTNQIHADKEGFVKWERTVADDKLRRRLSQDDRTFQYTPRTHQTFFQRLLSHWKRYRIAFEKLCITFWPVDLFTFTQEERRALRLAARDSFTFTKLNDPRIAKWLSHRGGQRALTNLQTIQPEIAKILVNTSDSLRLNAIQYLDNPLASTLASHRGRTLYLDNLHHIDIDVLEALARHTGRGLSLGGLASLSIQEALVLSNYRGRLSLNGLTNPNSATLAALMQHPGKSMSFGSLKSLSYPQAQQFATYKGDLYLQGLRDIPHEANSELDHFEGKIVLMHHERHPIAHRVTENRHSEKIMTRVRLCIAIATCIAILCLLLAFVLRKS